MFDIRQPILDPECGELDETLMHRYIEGLAKAFDESPEVQPFRDKFGWNSHLHIFLEYVIGYAGANVPLMDRGDVVEVLFELFPRKVSTEPESAAAIVAELHAFFGFLDRQYHHPRAKLLQAMMTDATEKRLRADLANPAKYGMAKSFVMKGVAAGYDMTTQNGNQAFMLEYNRRIAEARTGNPLLPLATLFQPPILGGSYLDDPIGAPFSPDKVRDERERRRKARKAERKARKKNRK